MNYFVILFIMMELINVGVILVWFIMFTIAKIVKISISFTLMCPF